MQRMMKPHIFVTALLILFLAGCTPGSEGRPAPAESERFSVVTLNIWHDQADWPARLAYMVRELRALRPDVICLQEVLQRPGLPNQAATLADSLGYAFHFVSVDGPESAKRYGNAILTPHPIVAENGRALDPKDDYRVAAHVRIAHGERRIDVYNTHLHYSGASGGTEVRSTQLRDLLAFIDSTRGGGPAVVAGDFNTLADAPELALIRSVQFRDAYAAVHPRGEAGTTLNPQMGHQPRRVDYIFFTEASLAPQHTEIVFGEATADSVWMSDHFGVYSRFSFVSTP